MKGAKPLGPPPAAISAVREAGLHAADGPTAALNLRLRVSTILAIERSAEATGRTMKLVLMEALKAAGVEVEPVDLVDRSPEKMRKWR